MGVKRMTRNPVWPVIASWYPGEVISESKSLNADLRIDGSLVGRTSRRVSQLNLKLNQEFKV